MTAVYVILFTVAGVLLTSLPACLPGLHVFNLIAIAIVGLHFAGAHEIILPAGAIVSLCAGMITGFSIFSSIPSIFLAAPDESAFFTVLPGQRFFRRGKGYEAVMLTAAGSTIGIIFICLLIIPAAASTIHILLSVLRSHTKWIIWVVICFMLMSEWPMAGRLRYGGWPKLAEAWKSLCAGLVTFVLSGCLGLLLFHRSPIHMEAAFQNLMPAFIGIFTLPWLLINCLSGRTTAAEAQTMTMSRVEPGLFIHGSISGILGGAFAALIPGVTGGVGGFLAGHASAMRNDRAFLISQGASRTVYYVGSFVLFFLPGISIVRGGASSMLSTVYHPPSCASFYMIIGAITTACATSILLLTPVVRLTTIVIGNVGHRRLSVAGLFTAVLFVFLFTGFEGLLVMLTAAGIGLIPVLYGSRRMNCLGLILIPLAIG